MSRPIDAAATLVGWINHTATDPNERTIAGGTTVKLSTPLDAADVFTFVASHPGTLTAVTFTLEVAPELLNGTMGTWVQAAEVAIPAGGGRVEAPLNGANLAVAPADASDVGAYSLYFARVLMTNPSDVSVTPAGAYAGLTF